MINYNNKSRLSQKGGLLCFAITGRGIEAVNLLGHAGKLEFEHTSEGLKVQLPEAAPGKSAYVFRIEGAIVS